ncbi:MAG: galactokinase [Candidatus Marinimicrobia bacterium]|nr:galactokinase [Candidatus Neomarinimicrobiota bacterium]
MKEWNSATLLNLITAQKREQLFEDLYGPLHDNHACLSRIQRLLSRAVGDAAYLISAPGRTELGGNHTDHNHGKVLCAAVRNDTLAAVTPRSDRKIRINSEGFPQAFEIDTDDLAPRDSEKGTTTALIRGVVAGFNQAGAKIGGFSAQITSNVSVGAGLSSSASFAVLIGTILNKLYNDEDIPAARIAQIGQYAENVFFSKPCGLMDQTACAVGGVLAIDFADPQKVAIRKLDVDLSAIDYVLTIVNTGSSHADLTDAYASIPTEMKLIAGHLGAEVLGSFTENQIMDSMSSLRSRYGDRAVLRALHFMSENKRVDQMVSALNAGDFDKYLQLVRASGASSQTILQNTIPPGSDGKAQGVAFALGLSQLFFEAQGRGVARVHGGGFAGTIQAYVHRNDFEDYRTQMNLIFGDQTVERLIIRKHGATTILSLA